MSSRAIRHAAASKRRSANKSKHHVKAPGLIRLSGPPKRGIRIPAQAHVPHNPGGRLKYADFISGNDNEKISYSSGKAKGVSEAFIAKVKMAASLPNVITFRGVYKANCVSGQCSYICFPMLYYTTDILAINAAIGAATANCTRFTCDDATQEVQVANVTDVQVFARVYQCEAREDIPLQPNYAPYGELTDGFTDAGVGAGAGQTDLTLTAFQSPGFVEDFKITSVKRFKFNPGETKVFTLHDKSPNNINMARWQNSGQQSIYCQRKRSRFLMLQFWGQVAGDTANLTHVGTAPCSLDCVGTTRYTYRFTQQAAMKETLTGVLTWGDGSAPQITAPLLAPLFVNELTGAAGVTYAAD